MATKKKVEMDECKVDREVGLYTRQRKNEAHSILH